MEDKIFAQCHSKLKKESVLKSLLCSAGIGFAAIFVSALIFWFVADKLWWVSFIIGFVAAAALTPLFYYKKFRPTVKQVAERIDRLGYEERFVTMLEYQNDTSYMAARQRTDAVETLRAANQKKPIGKSLKLSVSKALVVALAISVAVSIPMTTVTALSAEGIIGNGSEVIGGIVTTPAEPVYYTVEYKVELRDDNSDRDLEGGENSVEAYGFIDGNASQTVQEGFASETVVANAIVKVEIETEQKTVVDGMEVTTFTTETIYYMFKAWGDGSTDPERTEIDVRNDTVITAVFIQVPYEEAPEGISLNGEGGGGSGSGSGGGSPSTPSDPGNGSGNGAGGQFNDYDQIIDGETYYRDVYQDYYDRAMQILAEGGDIPEEMRKIIETYFGILL